MLGLALCTQTILAQDASLPTVTIAASSGKEGGNISFSVSISESVGQDVSFSYATSIETGDTAGTTDFTAVSAGSGTITAGTTSVPITVSVASDTVHEPNETFTVTISNVLPTTVAQLGTATAAKGTITNTTARPRLSIGNAGSVTEGADGAKTPMTFPLSLERTSVWDITISYGFNNQGTATSHADFEFPQRVQDRTVVISAGSNSANLIVNVKDDTHYEHGADELIIVNLQLPGDARQRVQFGNSSATGTIVDDEDPPEISISNRTRSYTEGESVPIDLTTTVTAQHAVDLTLTVTAGLGTSSSDFTQNKTTLKFPGHHRILSIGNVITLPEDDDLYEGDKSFEALLTGVSPAGAATFPSEAVRFEIVDSVAAPIVSIGDATADEGDSLSFTISSSTKASEDFHVYYYTTASTAATTDYSHIDSASPLTASIARNTQSTTITIDSTEDALAEEDETFTVTLSSIVSALGGITIDSTNSSGTGTIVDDDSAATPSVSISAPSSNTDEGETMTFPISLSGASGSAVSVPFTLSGTASANDYTAPKSPLSIAAGTTSASINVSTANDSRFEGNETVIVTLGTPTNATLDTDADSATGTIVDDEPVPQLSIADVEVDEGDSAKLTISTDTRSQRAISGTWITSDNTATSGADLDEGNSVYVVLGADGAGYRANINIANSGDEDYAEQSAGTFTIPAGKPSTNITVPTSEDDVYEGDEDFTVTIESSDTSEATVLDGTATVTIEEDESVPTISISSNESAAEGESIDFTVEVSPKSAEAITFDYVTKLTGTGTENAKTSDFSHVTQATEITVPANTDSVEISIDTTEDALHEKNETFTLEISNASGGNLGSKTSAEGTITNDDAAPIATLSASPTNVTEGNSPTTETDVTFTVTLNTVSGLDATVQFSVDSDGTDATSGEDYTLPSSNRVTISAGSRTAEFTVTVVGDDVYEGDEDLEVVISTVANGNSTVGTTSSATIVIEEDDAVPLLSMADVSVDEDDGSATLTVKTATKSAVDLTFSYVTAEGTASSSDFDHSATKTSITLGARATSKTFSIDITDDSIDETDTETFTVTLSDLAPAGKATWASGGDSATVTINDEDATPTISIADGSADEGDNVDLVVTLNGTSSRAIGFTWTTANKTAGSSDYTTTTSAESESIAAGDTTHTISIATTEDTISEADETFTVTIVAGVTHVTLGRSTATATIEDNDGSATVSIADATDLTEGDSDDDDQTMRFTVALNKASSSAVSVPFWIDGDETTAEETDDYTFTTTSPLMIPAGDTSGSIALAIKGDDLYEGDEVIKIRIGVPSGARRHSTNNAASGRVLENDSMPVASIADVSVDEGDSATLTVSVTPGAEVDLPIQVHLTGVNNTAAYNVDYTGFTNQTLTFTGGATKRTYDVATIEDSIDELDETFRVGIIPDRSRFRPDGHKRTAVVTIKDDDDTPTATIQPSNGDEGTDIAFAVGLTNASFRGITLNYETLDSSDSSSYTATGGTDFTAATATDSITIKAGDTAGSISITTVQDEAEEEDETFGIRFINPPDHVQISSTAVIGTINDNDEDTTPVSTDPEVSIANATAVTEGDLAGSTVNLTFSVTLSKANTNAVVTVPYTLGGTATSSDDYVAHATTPSLKIPVGDTSANITIAVKGDTLAEPNETVTVTLGTPTNATIKSGEGSASGTINDDDPDPEVSVAAPKAVTEGDDSSVTTDMVFTVTLSAASGKVITVPYTLGGTATSGDDYVAHAANPSLTIPVGDNSGTITVAIKGDVDAEESETVTVTLGAPTNATIEAGSGSASGTITDNDGIPTVGVTNASAVVEGDDPNTTKNMTFAVSLSAEAKKTVTVPYTLGGTATSGDDYVAHAANPSLTIAIGDNSATITVVIKGDVDAEESETVTVTLGAPTNATIKTDGGTASGTITDNDGIPTVSVADASAVVEGDDPNTTKNMTFAVSLSAAAKKIVTVPYTLGGTATSGDDYVAPPANPSLTIAIGDNSATITVAIKGDVDTEESETVSVTLGAPTNATIEAGSGSASGTITDNDGIPTVGVTNASAVVEGDDPNTTKNMTFAVSLSAAAKKIVTVPYTLGGTATSGDDYVAHPANSSLTIAIGDNSGTITVAVKGDVDTEESETVTVTLGAPTNATIKTDGGTASGTITDNDGIPTVSVADASAVVEGDDPNTTKNMTFAVSLSAAAKKIVTVPYTLGGTATSGDDYVAHSTNPSLTISIGDNSASILVAVKGDLETEVAETVTVTLGTPTNATVASEGGSASGTITDNDAIPTVGVTNAGVVLEGDDPNTTTNMTFAVSLSAVAKKAVTVPYTLGGTATSGNDYVAHVANPSLTIAVGDNSATITIAIKGDVDTEESETVTVTLGAPTNATIEAGSGTASGTITDNDAIPSVGVTNASAVVEGDDPNTTTNMTFAVSLSAAAKKTVTVPYTLDGTATSGDDYVAHADNPSLTIAIGDNSATITVAIKGDEEVEGTETVTVTLGTPTNATLTPGAGSASGSIVDNDQETLTTVVQISNAATTIEGGPGSSEELVFSISLSQALDESLSVSYTLGGSATAGTDFVSLGSSPSIDIPANTVNDQIVLEVIGDTVDEGDEVVEVTLSPSSNDEYEIAANAGTASGTIENDDLPEIQLSVAKLQVEEGDLASYEISLDEEPSESFTITASAPFGAVDFKSSTIEITPANWRDPEPFEITADTDDDARPMSLVVEHSIAPTKFEAILLPTLPVQVIDLDTDGVLVSESVIELEERTKGSYQVSLNAQPMSDVTVIPTPVRARAIAVSSSLTFTADNWSEKQEVEVAVLDNGAFVNNLTSVIHKVYGHHYEELTHPAVAISINNDLAPRVAVAPELINLREGESTTYSVVLSSAPGGTVNISATSQSPEMVTVSDPIEFDDSNWFLPQRLKVTSIDDNQRSDNQVSIDHVVTGADSIENPSVVMVYVHDNDIRELEFSEPFLIVDEGATVEYEISLRSPPSAEMRVEITTEDEELESRVAITEALVFTPDTWNTPQSVQVVAHADSVDREFVRTKINHETNGGGYTGAPISQLALSILDDDHKGVVLSDSTLKVFERESVSYTVRLTSKPLQEVTVTPVATGSSQHRNLIEFSSPLKFNSLNWHTPQAIKVQAVTGDIDGSIELTIVHQAQGNGYEELELPSTQLTYIDRDVFGVTIQPDMLSIAAGQQESYDIYLNDDPGSDLVVEITPSNTEALSAPETIQFSRESWDEVQSVTVAVHENAQAWQLEPITLSHAITSGRHQTINIEPVKVTVIEGEDTGVLVSVDAINLQEGESAEITLRLAAAPEEDLRVEPISSRDGLFTFDPEAIVFTSEDWKSEKRIVIHAADNDLLGILEETITWRVTGDEYFANIEPAITPVVIFDNDAPAIISDRTMVQMDEGSSIPMHLSLSHPPKADVVVEFRAEGRAITIEPSELIFTIEDWQTKKTVSVMANDDDRVNRIVSTIECVARGGGYDDAGAIETVVEVIENDEIGVDIGFPEFVHEGRSQSYSVVLKSRPANTVSVTPISQNEDVLAVSDSVEFQPDEWNVPQEIKLTASTDSDSQPEIVEVWHDIQGGAFGALAEPARRIEVLDDDAASVWIRPTVVNVEEGATATYSIVLARQPSGTVAVEATSPDQDVLTVSDAIEFTSSNWRVAQQITVTSTENSIDEDTTVKLTHTITGGGYDAVDVADVSVKITNTNVAESMPTELTVQAGIPAVYTVTLMQEPVANWMVTPASSPSGVLNVSPAEREISAENWDQPVEFTVTLPTDFDQTTEINSIEIAHSLSTGQEGAATSLDNVAKVIVQLPSDQEQVAIQASMVVHSNGTAVVDLVLPVEPIAPVRISTHGVGQPFQFAPNNVAFSSYNWSDAQSIVILSAADEETISPIAARKAIDALTVVSDDQRYNGTAIEISHVANSAQAYRVAQGILEPLTGTVARLNADRVMKCIDAAIRSDSALNESSLSGDLSKRWTKEATEDNWLTQDNRNTDGFGNRFGQNRNANLKLGSRLTLCSDTTRLSTVSQDDMRVSSRGSSGYIGGSLRLNEHYLLGLGVERLTQSVDWREASIDLEGEADLHLNTVNPFIARFSDNQSKHIWGMASIGSGTMALTGDTSVNSVYDLAYQGLGLGGSWTLPGSSSLSLWGQSWWASTEAVSIDRQFEDVHVESHATRMGASGDWTFKIGQELELETSLSSGLLNDSSIGTTALENLLGLSLTHTVLGVSAELQMHSVSTRDSSYQSTRTSTVLSYQGSSCCNQSGPWFKLRLGESSNPIFAGATGSSYRGFRPREGSQYNSDSWRIETGMNTEQSYLGIALNPAIWVSQSADRSGYSFGLSNTHDAGHGMSFRTRVFSRVRGQSDRDIGVLGQFKWAW